MVVEILRAEYWYKEKQIFVVADDGIRGYLVIGDLKWIRKEDCKVLRP